MPTTEGVYIMAGLNGTGPNGRGKLTGRGLGNCTGEVVNNTRNNGSGRGLGRCNFQQGLGRRRGLNRADTSENELEILRNRISELEEKLNS